MYTPLKTASVQAIEVLMRRRTRFQKRSREFIIMRKTRRVFVLIMSDSFHGIRQLLFDPVYFFVNFFCGFSDQRHTMTRVSNRDEMRMMRDIGKVLEVSIAINRDGIPRVPVMIHDQRVRLHFVEFDPPRGRLYCWDERLVYGVPD